MLSDNNEIVLACDSRGSATKRFAKATASTIHHVGFSIMKDSLCRMRIIGTKMSDDINHDDVFHLEKVSFKSLPLIER